MPGWRDGGLARGSPVDTGRGGSWLRIPKRQCGARREPVPRVEAGVGGLGSEVGVVGVFWATESLNDL